MQTDMAEWTTGNRSARTVSPVQGVDCNLEH